VSAKFSSFSRRLEEAPFDPAAIASRVFSREAEETGKQRLAGKRSEF
jgi:hypothetical protein